MKPLGYCRDCAARETLCGGGYCARGAEREPRKKRGRAIEKRRTKKAGKR